MKCLPTGAFCPAYAPRPTASTSALQAFLLLIAIAFAISPSLHAQATGSFSGTVTDKSGSNVSGASVTATSGATGLVRTGKTDEGGHYVIPLLPAGAYTVRVNSSGFQPAETKDLTLQVDQALELNFTLVPANVTTTVEVSANAVAAETSNASLGQVITSQEVSQLPLNGRDFVQLATLTSGATAETNPNSFFTSAPSSEIAARGPLSLSVGGSRPNSNDWLLDNVDNNELTARRHLHLDVHRRHPRVQGAHLHLLCRVRNPRRPDRARHHQIRL